MKETNTTKTEQGKMANSNLRRKSFETKDANGCEFPVEVHYERKSGERKFEVSKVYAMGMEAGSLDEMREKVANL